MFIFLQNQFDKRVVGLASPSQHTLILYLVYVNFLFPLCLGCYFTFVKICQHANPKSTPFLFCLLDFSINTIPGIEREEGEDGETLAHGFSFLSGEADSWFEISELPQPCFDTHPWFCPAFFPV